MVKRDRVAGSWLGRHSRCYTYCSSASLLRLLGRKQPAWGNARELSHPSTPKSSTPLRKILYKGKFSGSCSGVAKVTWPLQGATFGGDFS